MTEIRDVKGRILLLFLLVLFVVVVVVVSLPFRFFRMIDIFWIQGKESNRNVTVFVIANELSEYYVKLLNKHNKT